MRQKQALRAIPVWTLAGALFVFLVVYHSGARNWLPPIHDASNCVARASNLGIALGNGLWSIVGQQLAIETNNFLSVLYFGLMSSMFGPGRAAWGWGWALAWLGWIAAQSWILRPVLSRQRLFVAVLLALGAGPLLALDGGLFDQRFDPLAVLLLSLSASAWLARRPHLCAGLALAAIFAKGPSLPVVVALAVCLGLANLGRYQEVWRDLKPGRWIWAVYALLGAVYLKWFLAAVVSYNLMASAHGTSGGAPVLAFISQTLRELAAAPWFYFRALRDLAPAFPVVLIGTIGVGFLRGRVWRWAAFGLLWLGMIYALFSAHPVKTPVLLVWFFPAVWVCALAVAASKQDSLRVSRILVVSALVAAIWTGLSLERRASREQFAFTPEKQKLWSAMKQQASFLAQSLENRPGDPERPVRLLVNFLYTPERRLTFHYDAYRVLIFESLGRRSPLLDGWELGTFGPDWKKEIDASPGAGSLLVLLATEAPEEALPGKRGVTITRSVLAALPSRCEIRDPNATRAGVMGDIRYYWTMPDLKTCMRP